MRKVHNNLADLWEDINTAQRLHWLTRAEVDPNGRLGHSQTKWLELPSKVQAQLERVK